MRKGEHERERAAGAHGARDSDATAMGLGDPAHDAQAQPGSAAVAGARLSSPLCWLVTSSALKGCGRSLGQNPGAQGLCAL